MLQAEDGIPPLDRYLDALFGASGYLSRAFPNYRPRPGQIALAEAVDRAIVARGHLLAEGPTGTGKSLAYAAPASYHAWSTGRPVVIVTANIALQEQIVTKDLPLLRRVAPWPFTFALLKGRNNYLCVDRFYRHEAEKSRPSLYDPKPEERKQLPIIEQWAADCVKAGIGVETGDVSDLPFEPLPQLWKQFSVAASDCKRSRCRFKDECFAIEASERAKQAHVIVTNYHMLYAHLAVYLQTGIDVVISPFEVAILDEAHKAADIARDVFGFKITGETLRRVEKTIADDDRDLAERLQHAGGDFLLWMLELRRNRDRYKSRLTGDFSAAEVRAWQELNDALEVACTLLSEKAEYLEAELARLEGEGLGMSDEAKELGDQLGDAEIARDRAVGVRHNLKQAMHPRENARGVFFLEEDERGRVSVCSKLVEAADALRPGLFEKHVAPPQKPQGGPPVTVIATSATLATAGDSFEFVARELGCPPGYASLVASSPFDWPNQCLFICPEGMPEPNAPEFKDAVAAVVERTIRLARGRTLGLFTSRRVLEHTYNAVAKPCVELGYTLLRQGDAPRTALIDTFKRDVSSVLLGTESFWAGVDVPGESLSVVVIDRLPFPTPDDPILDAVASRDKDWFQHYSIPRAMIAFKQGFGRLVRSLECRGVVVCCDSRLVGKRYGKQFLRAMPPVPKSTRLDAIAEWLGLPLPEAAAPAAAPAPLVLTPPPEPPAPAPQLALFLQPDPPPAPKAAEPAPLPAGWDDVGVFAAPATELPAGWDDVEVPPPPALAPTADAWDAP